MRTKLLTLLLPAVLTVSCSQSDDGPSKEEPYFRIESGQTEWFVSEEGGTQDYVVKSNGQWNIIRRSAETWAEAKPGSGENDGSFRIKVEENKTEENRSMRFSFMLNGEELPESVAVSQEGKELIYDEPDNQDIITIKAGIPAYSETNLTYRRNGSSILQAELKEPVVVAVAERPEDWGYFQFPNINRSGNVLVASWSMAPDSESSYGKGAQGFRLSEDNGKTWYVSETRPLTGGLMLPDGGRIIVATPAALDVETLQLPAPLATVREAYGRTFSFYRMNDLPDELQGVYIAYYDPAGQASLIHATLDDRNVVRYASDGLFPIVWWGDMKLLPDNSIVIGIYPAFYENDEGGVDPSGVSFYRSTDQGMTWKILGKIPYTPDPATDPNGNRRLAFGYTEPAFEILQDGTYLCVMRTTDGYGHGPMYISRSTDQGTAWSKAVTFAPSGILPRLLQLENGVLVLVSGRQGVQVRFSVDGKGEKWTDPFEMLPFASPTWASVEDMVSCGNAAIMATGPDSFLLIYSDFKYLNQDNEVRKAIKIREVKVTPAK